MTDVRTSKFPLVPNASMSLDRCRGCYNDVYNGQLAQRCWSFAGAVIVLKKEVSVDQTPPWNQPASELPDCFRRQRCVYVQPDQTN